MNQGSKEAIKRRRRRKRGKEDGEKLVSQVEITDQLLPSRAFNLE